MDKLDLKTRIITTLCCVAVFTLLAIFQPSDWKAPEEANKLVNPFKGKSDAAAAGKKIYDGDCWTCHGDKGKGNGQAGVNLEPRPANFTLSEFQQQTDGAIYWKITEGRPPMQSYKTKYTDLQRWALVNYLRTFAKDDKAS